MSFKLKTSSPSISKASTYINELLGTSDKTRFGENRADILDESNTAKNGNTTTALWTYRMKTLSAMTTWIGAACPCTLPFSYNFHLMQKVPKTFIGKRNPIERVILLSFTLQNKGDVGLFRNGPGKPDPQEEKWVPVASKKSDHIVIEIKNNTNSNANRNKQQGLIGKPP